VINLARTTIPNWKTKQTGRIITRPSYGLGVATTRYNQVSLLGDLNFSNFFRRTDNKSSFRWALHGYAGIGLQGYDSKEMMISLCLHCQTEIR
jgi:hypothetical protein